MEIHVHCLCKSNFLVVKQLILNIFLWTAASSPLVIPREDDLLCGSNDRLQKMGWYFVSNLPLMV
jgi:hypothetical protein